MNMLFRPRVNGTVCVEDLYKELTASRPVVLVQDHWLERPVLMLPMQFINPDTLARFQAVSQGALEAVIPFDMPRREAADDEVLPTSRLGFLMSLVRDETVPSYSSGFTLRFAHRQRFRACADVYEAALALCTASGLVARALLAPLAPDQTVAFGEDHGYKTAYIKDVQAFAKKDQFGDAETSCSTAFEFGVMASDLI